VAPCSSSVPLQQPQRELWCRVVLVCTCQPAFAPVCVSGWASLLVEDCLAGGLLPVIRVYPGSNTAKHTLHTARGHLHRCVSCWASW